jgi:hypothetical protein
MDTNWCTVCDQHIDYRNSTLYCSPQCRERDSSPNTSPNVSFASASSSVTLSPLTKTFPTTSPTQVSPQFRYSSVNKLSPPELSLGRARMESGMGQQTTHLLLNRFS